MNNTSREANSIRNFIVGVLNQVLILFLNLLAKSIFIKSLGPVFMGLNGLFTNIFLLLSFAEFGIGSVMVYSLYGPISRDDKGEVTTIYKLFKKIYIVLSITIGIIGIAIIPLLPLIVNVEKPIANLTFFYCLYLTGVVISNIYMYKAHIILADQKTYILSLYGLVFESAALIFQIIFLIRTKNYGVYLLIFITKNLLYGLATSYKVHSLYPFLRKTGDSGQLDEAEKKTIYKKIVDVFSYKFARVFINGTDNILISILVGTIWVGYYSNYDLVIMGVLGLVTTFYSGISASVGNLVAKEDLEHQYNIFELIQILNMWITGFTITCLYILFQDFIGLWLGGAYIIDFKIVILILINYYLVCNRKSITIFREAAGMFNKIKNAVFLGALLNIILSLVLGYLIGIYGILLGTTISAVSTYYWYEAKILMRDKFSKSMKPLIKNQIENIIYTIVSIALTSVAVYPIKSTSLASFILKAIICLVVPNIFYILILKRKERFKVIIELMLRNYNNIRGRWRHG